MMHVLRGGRRRAGSRNGWRGLSWAVLIVVLVSLASPLAHAAQEPVQHGAQPNPGEVRPPSPQGNAPSPATGTLEKDESPGRLFGVPTGLALSLVALIAIVVGLWLYSRRPRPGLSEHRRTP